jgi:hypothetical protein
MITQILFWTLIAVGIFLYVVIGKILCNCLDIKNKPWDGSIEFMGVLFWPVIFVIMVPLWVITAAVELADYISKDSKK